MLPPGISYNENWNSNSIVKTKYICLNSGEHTMKITGFDGCCNKKMKVDFKLIPTNNYVVKNKIRIY